MTEEYTFIFIHTWFSLCSIVMISLFMLLPITNWKCANVISDVTGILNAYINDGITCICHDRDNVHLFYVGESKSRIINANGMFHSALRYNNIFNYRGKRPQLLRYPLISKWLWLAHILKAAKPFLFKKAFLVIRGPGKLFSMGHTHFG